MHVYIYTVSLYIIGMIFKKGIGIESEKSMQTSYGSNSMYISSSFKYPLLHYHCSPSTSQIFLVSTPPFCLFRCFPIPSEPVLHPSTLKTFFVSIQHEQWTPPSIIQFTHGKTVIYSLWHKPLHIPNMASSNLCR